MTKKEAGEFVMTFGKYKGNTLGNIFKADHKYLDWVYKNSFDKKLSLVIAVLFGWVEADIDIDESKVEQIIKECIMARGYAQAEADKFISILKKE